MASINGDTAISKFKLGADFQAKNQSRCNGMDDEVRQNLSTIFRYLYVFQLKPMVLFDWKVIVNLHTK